MKKNHWQRFYSGSMADKMFTTFTYHCKIVTINHNWSTSSKVDIFFPPITNLQHEEQENE